jgi:hypothetical protein
MLKAKPEAPGELNPPDHTAKYETGAARWARQGLNELVN